MAEEVSGLSPGAVLAESYPFRVPPPDGVWAEGVGTVGAWLPSELECLDPGPWVQS